MVFDTELEKLINAIVIIEWEDISGYADSWMDKKDIYDIHPHQCISIAKLYECNKEYITVAATWGSTSTSTSTYTATATANDTSTSTLTSTCTSTSTYF